LSLPAGPGGFQPSLPLNYSSGSVNENHGWQSASPWVGQGWSLDLGSINWAQENVTPNGTATLENVCEGICLCSNEGNCSVQSA
jgi:hypothetical protein